MLLFKPRSNTNHQVLANDRHISNLPFISKILEKAVAKQLCDYLDSNGLLEDLSQDLESITAQKQHY